MEQLNKPSLSQILEIFNILAFQKGVIWLHMQVKINQLFPMDSYALLMQPIQLIVLPNSISELIIWTAQWEESSSLTQPTTSFSLQVQRTILSASFLWQVKLEASDRNAHNASLIQSTQDLSSSQSTMFMDPLAALMTIHLFASFYFLHLKAM